MPDLLETKYLSSLIRKNKSILDAGCGNGIFLKRIQKIVKYKKALGFDYSQGMIKYEKSQKLKKTDFYTIDFTKPNELEYIKSKFDYIITKRSLINIKNELEQTLIK